MCLSVMQSWESEVGWRGEGFREGGGGGGEKTRSIIIMRGARMAEW